MIFDTLVRYSDAGVDLVPTSRPPGNPPPNATLFTFISATTSTCDGRLVTSADFKYAHRRVLNPATRSKGIEYYRAIVGAADSPRIAPNPSPA